MPSWKHCHTIHVCGPTKQPRKKLNPSSWKFLKFVWNAVVDNLEFETLLLFAFVSANGPLSFQQSPPLQSKTNSDDVSLHRYCFSGPKSRVALCRCLRTAIVSAVRSRTSLCADVCGLLLFQLSEVERCAVQMSADCYCFSSPKSSIALRRCLRTAIALAVECWTLIGRKFYRLLLFQQSPLHHLSSQARVQVDESCADNMCSLTRLNQLRVNIHRVSSTFRTLRQLSQILRNFPNFSATFPIGSA